MKKPSPQSWKTIILSTGLVFIVLACVVGVMSLYEAFFGWRGNMIVVEVPGFQELKLKTPGHYVGLYQHRQTSPIPVEALSKIEIHILSKDTYQEVPVAVNTTGQVVERMGMKAMPLFNFVIETPGDYTMSALYPSEGAGPAVPILIFSQSVGNIKPTLIVGGIFFVVFLGIGIFILVHLKKENPAIAPTTPSRTKPA